MMTPAGEEKVFAAQETAKCCLRTLRYCLEWGGPLVDTEPLLALLGCAQACRALADAAADALDLAPKLEACAAACERCALACDRFDDLELRECAQLCRFCAPVCRRPPA